jgi:hypothetical protein
MIATGEDDLMANRSDRRLPTLVAVRTHYHEAARMIREPGARISIRARAAYLPPITQAGYMTATVPLDHHSPLACGLVQGNDHWKINRRRVEELRLSRALTRARSFSSFRTTRLTPAIKREELLKQYYESRDNRSQSHPQHYP